MTDKKHTGNINTVPDVQVRVTSIIQHFSQIFTGFQLLANQGLIKLRYINCTHMPHSVPENVLEVICDGCKVAFDVSDGYNNVNDMYLQYLKSDVLYIFKRSFSQKLNDDYFGQYSIKILPLGLNYHVCCPGIPNDSIAYRKGIKNKVRRLINNLAIWLLNTPRTADVSNFECEPIDMSDGRRPNIIFYTRLWDPDHMTGEKTRQERILINNCRIEIIRMLRDKYPDAFAGGLEDNDIAQSMARDLILPKEQTS